MNVTNTASRVFLQYMYRDAYVHKRKLRDYVVNFVIAYPTIFSLAYGYLQPQAYFGTDAHAIYMGTMLLSGNIVLVIMFFSYKLNIELLFDFENNRMIDYQIMVLDPRLVIVQRVLFNSLLTWAMTLPFFPVAKLILGHQFDTSATNWLMLAIILLLGSIYGSIHHLLAACVLQKTTQISSLWARVNHIMITFGGFWIPHHVIYQYSPLLGAIMYFNPILYLSEGIRRAILNQDIFFLWHRSCLALVLINILGLIMVFYAFKKRTDHV